MSKSIVGSAYNTPFIVAYPWSDLGFGAKFSDPVTLPPAGYANGCDISDDNAAVAVAFGGNPGVAVYPWSLSGFGTKFSDVSPTPPGNYSNDVQFTNGFIAIDLGVSPFISVYPWSNSGFGMKLSDPAIVPGYAGHGLSFTSTHDAIAIGLHHGAFVGVYPWSGAGFGTKFSDPGIALTDYTVGLTFSPSDSAIAIGHNNVLEVTVYAWSNAGFGSKFSDPITPSPGSDYGGNIAFTSTEDAIAVPQQHAGGFRVYPWSNAGFGTQFSGSAFAEGGTGVSFTSANDALAIDFDAYPWSNSGFGSRFTSPDVSTYSTIGQVVFDTVSDGPVPIDISVSNTLTLSQDIEQSVHVIPGDNVVLQINLPYTIKVTRHIQSIDPNDSNVTKHWEQEIDLNLSSVMAILIGPNQPTDASLVPNQVTMWFDSTNGSSKLMVKGKSADGTVVTGEVDLG